MARTLRFVKMQGCANDYIYIDCFKEAVDDPSALAVKLSRRHFSVGADGVILICPSEKADVRMRMFNADGSEGKMCGNGVRCVAKYAFDSGIAHKEEISVETPAGIKTIRVFVDERGKVASACVNMGKAILQPKKIPALFDGKEAINVSLTVLDKTYQITAVSMGNPHAVTFVEPDFDLWHFDIEKIGPYFEKHEKFPERVNTEFVRVLDRTHLEMRVWERGSGETYACGTGTCATVVAACENGLCDKNTDVTVRLLGGDLVIRYTDEAVFMTGPCEEVYRGEIEL